MKKFYLIDTKNNNSIITTYEAKNEKEARKYATSNFLNLIIEGGIAVASENRYNQFYK